MNRSENIFKWALFSEEGKDVLKHCSKNEQKIAYAILLSNNPQVAADAIDETLEILNITVTPSFQKFLTVCAGDEDETIN